MLTRREYYVRLCVGAVVGVAWCLGGGWYLHGLGWSFGLILLLDVAVTGALVVSSKDVGHPEFDETLEGCLPSDPGMPPGEIIVA